LGYIPLPANVAQKVSAAADAISAEYKISVGGGAGGASANK
jgi:phosphate transport system substrate-binding protein